MVDPSRPPSLWDAFRTGLKDLQIHWKQASGDSFGRELGSFLGEPSGAGSSPARQNFVTGYVPFDVNIPASDVAAINAQQVTRNGAFLDWVGGICTRLQEMGFSPEANFDQAPENWYVQPATAQIRILNAEPEKSCRLTLYHYDAWQGLDAATLVVGLAALPLDES